MPGGFESIPIIAICGARRTGTTLVNQILCCDPGAHSQVGEARLATQLLQVFAWGRENYENVVKWYFASEEAYAAFFKRIIDDFLANAHGQLRPVDKLILKTPAFSPVIDQAIELLPTSRYLVCVRHPLDQVASDFEVGLRQAAQGMTAGNRAKARNFTAYARTYLAQYEKILAASQRHPSRFVFLRYEDLLQHPQKSLRHLESALNLDLSSYDPNAPWTNFQNQAELARMPANVPQYGQPLDRTRVGRHQGVLSSEEAARVTEICASIIERFYADQSGE